MIKSLSYTVKPLFVFFIMLSADNLQAQLNQKKITGLYTDYLGGWASRETAVNSNTVVLSHNLLAFTYNGTTYRTGANNSLLTSNGIVTASGNYQAMPIASLGGTVTSGNSIFGLLPASDDGNASGFVTPYPSYGIKDLLTDGLNGLNIGTGITNLPINALLTYNINAISPTALTDTRPVIICTQIAATGGGKDLLYFVDINGNTVGDTIKADWGGTMTPVIGRHSCDLYTLSTGPANNSLINGASASSQAKEIRMSGFMFSDFNINSSNIHSVAKFIVTPGGESDPAFVAYNTDILTSYSTLPVTFSYVQGVLRNDQAYITWQTGTESNSDRFVIEKSIDTRSFSAIGSVRAAGNSSLPLNYSYIDMDPAVSGAYYRIKQYDKDGKFMISKTIQVSGTTAGDKVTVQAIPSAGTLIVKHPAVSGKAFVQVLNMSGAVVGQQQLSEGVTESRVAIKSYTSGIYQMVLTDGDKRTVKRVFMN